MELFEGMAAARDGRGTGGETGRAGTAHGGTAGSAGGNAAGDAPGGGGAAPSVPDAPGLSGATPETRDGYALPRHWAGEGVHEAIAARVSGILEQDREAFADVCHACKLTDTQAAALFDSLGRRWRAVSRRITRHTIQASRKPSTASGRTIPPGTWQSPGAARGS